MEDFLALFAPGGRGCVLFGPIVVRGQWVALPHTAVTQLPCRRASPQKTHSFQGMQTNSRCFGKSDQGRANTGLSLQTLPVGLHSLQGGTWHPGSNEMLYRIRGRNAVGVTVGHSKACLFTSCCMEIYNLHLLFSVCSNHWPGHRDNANYLAGLIQTCDI